MAGIPRNTEQTVLDRISKEPTSGCWLWIGARDHYGYGAIHLKAVLRKAHRVVYEMYKGTIPEGLELDHKCRLTCCVNPDHLEPVTHKENLRRAGISGVAAKNAAKTHCPHGHELTPENIKVANHGMGRRCRICANAASRIAKQMARARKKAA